MTDGFVAVARYDDLADGEMTAASVGGNDVLIARVAGRCFATAGICTHALGYLDEGELDGYEVLCPLHEGRFDVRNGEVTHAPAVQPLRTYAVEVRDGDVCVAVSSPAARTS
jgi:nitrite reductase/ring-hydroxylating ferredoxin subunit